MRLFLEGPITNTEHDRFTSVLTAVWEQSLAQAEVELSTTAHYVFEG